ncbi:MAG: hypothetical protein IPM92_10085 [Saprospiraceae bacterium]|nr:hypothetical protein [Saprospiraceae bacterium]
MQSPDFTLRTFLGACLLVVFSIGSWELYLRHLGFQPAYNDEADFWAHERRKVYQAKDDATVFIGSSRIKFDLDAETWMQETGEQAIQLACVGSTPLPVLHDLANDEKFKGKLIIDITEKLFFNFSPSPYSRPNDGIKYQKEESYAQKASYHIDWFLQTYLVFLDKENFTLNPMFGKLPVPKREGVMLPPSFPSGFERVNQYRQSVITEAFAADTTETRKVKNIWKFFGEMGKKKPRPTASQIDSLLSVVQVDVQKLKSRGVDVVFTRTPSTGDEIAGENFAFPRALYWQRILDTTQCKGIFFTDYPEMAALDCPEYSHLDHSGAKIFTKKLIEILRNEHAWALKNQN